MAVQGAYGLRFSRASRAAGPQVLDAGGTFEPSLAGALEAAWLGARDGPRWTCVSCPERPAEPAVRLLKGITNASVIPLASARAVCPRASLGGICPMFQGGSGPARRGAACSAAHGARRRAYAHLRCLSFCGAATPGLGRGSRPRRRGVPAIGIRCSGAGDHFPSPARPEGHRRRLARGSLLRRCVGDAAATAPRPSRDAMSPSRMDTGSPERRIR